MSRSIIQVPGFEFAGIPCGIKTSQLADLALIYSDPPASVVGAFTENQVKAAPVLISERNIRAGRCSAVIINSGNANACTGKRGFRAALRMTESVARTLNIPKNQVLVCSTGKIGVPLPTDKIVRSISRLVASLDRSHLKQAARAILTTDQSVKVASATGLIGGKRFHLAGFAKGAGMIEPHLKQATMLAFFVTDLKLPRKILQTIFGRCLDQTFNRITVDGDTSTNDTALLLANGVCGNRMIRVGSVAARLFERELFNVMQRLALMMVADGEGATKVIRIEVRGAKSEAQARKIAYAVGNSPLVKTAFFGCDPNWGRILAAAGRSGATVRPELADISIEGIPLVRRGVAVRGRAGQQAKQVMKKKPLTLTIDLHLGRGGFKIWASDLTLDYVKLNSKYRT